MQTLSENYTQQELDYALGWTGIEVDLNDANGIYSLWAGEKYLGGFVDMNGVVEEVNLHISIRNDRIEDAIQREQVLADALKDATSAVLLNSAGRPIYEINTPLRGGEYAEVAGGTTADGTPFNRREFKVSRNKKFICQELPIASAALDKFGDLYYLA